MPGPAIDDISARGDTLEKTTANGRPLTGRMVLNRPLPADTVIAAVAVLAWRCTRESEQRIGLAGDDRAYAVTLTGDLTLAEVAARLRTAEPGPEPSLWLHATPKGAYVLRYDPRELGVSAEAGPAHVAMLLADAHTAPTRPVAELRLLSEALARRLVEDVNDTGPGHGDDLPVTARIGELARTGPDRIAIVHGDTRLRYADLWAGATRVAARLAALGVTRHTLVGLCLDRSPELVTAALGTLLAGGAYVGLDIDEPAARRVSTLDDSRAPLVITRAGWTGMLPGAAAKVLTIEDLLAEPDGTDPVGGNDIDHDPSDPCYVTYTSGSTGRPKGVLVPHEGVTNLTGWYRRTFGLGPGDRMPQLARPSFDGWALEVWPALTAGATLCIQPGKLPDSADALARRLAGDGITVCFLTTALAVDLFDQPWETLDHRLRVMLVGGEKLTRYPRADLPFAVHNVYGPTETSMLATCGLMDPAVPRDQAPPIGRPLSGMRAYVVDERDRPVPYGAIGELLIGGLGIARGYLGRPDLTEIRFRPDPFRPGGRVYATGDLVRRLPDGQLDFVGRVDDQVKLRGFRIEPGEIETVLRRHRAVRDAVVVVHAGETSGPAASDGSRLVAYLTADGPLSLDDVRTHATAHLPHFMVPQVLIPIDAVPLTPHGKTDRRALAARPLPTAAPTGGDAPRTDLERLLADVWREVLDVDEINRDSSFFDLGGDSLQAMRAAGRARQRGVTLGAEDIFDNEVLGELAAELEGRS
jgi:amino acid adenylation domain-containing protein